MADCSAPTGVRPPPEDDPLRRATKVRLLPEAIRLISWLTAVLLCEGVAVGGEGLGKPESPARPKQIRVAAVQARLQWYQTRSDFEAKMTALVRRAMRRSPQLIVFPEQIGTSLVAMGKVPGLAHSTSLEAAFLSLILPEFPRLQPVMQKNRVSAQRALFVSRATAMREAYFGAFSRLSKGNAVHILAGSITLPEPEDSTKVSNVAYLFDPGGRVIGCQRKVHLSDLEGPAGLDLVPGSIDQSRVFDTPVGRLGVAICLDCFHKEVIAHLVRSGAQLLIDPSANPKLFTKEEQKENLAGLFDRVGETHCPGVQCFAVGDFAGLPFRGKTWILTPPDHGPSEPSVAAIAKSDSDEEVVCATVSLSG